MWRSGGHGGGSADGGAKLLRVGPGLLSASRPVLSERKHRACRIGELEAENARLKVEVERLTAFTTRTIIPNEELQAQVERLTKAGDAMAKTIGENGVSYRGSFLDVSDSINRWYAAKEGKGQP